jgi:hypothetical protein
VIFLSRPRFVPTNLNVWEPNFNMAANCRSRMRLFHDPRNSAVSRLYLSGLV